MPELSLHEKAEAILAELTRLVDTTPGGLLIRKVGADVESPYAIKEESNGYTGRSWLVTVPPDEPWEETVQALYEMLCLTRGRPSR